MTRGGSPDGRWWREGGGGEGGSGEGGDGEGGGLGGGGEGGGGEGGGGLGGGGDGGGGEGSGGGGMRSVRARQPTAAAMAPEKGRASRVARVMPRSRTVDACARLLGGSAGPGELERLGQGVGGETATACCGEESQSHVL